jgi:Glycosyl transferase family 2
MHPAPRLSVGLPVYNGEQYLAASLDALLGQTYGDFELIISDNASTDRTADICWHYQKLDSRVRYVRQPRNLGAAANHHFVFQESQGELFKWASADDLYAPQLLQCGVDALDEFPEVVLAHSYTAAIDANGSVTQALEYPLATGSRLAPERFRSMLFGSGEDDEGLIRADDQYGVIRAHVLRRILPQGSYYHSDRTMMAAVSLHGPFYQTPEWLYFRRDHAGRPQHACRTVRTWCANLDPRRADRRLHPTARLVLEYPLGYLLAIRAAPLSSADRRACYAHLVRWSMVRAAAAGRARALAARGSSSLRRVVSDASPAIADRRESPS